MSKRKRSAGMVDLADLAEDCLEPLTQEGFEEWRDEVLSSIPTSVKAFFGLCQVWQTETSSSDSESVSRASPYSN
jgi:hypothetical protein